MATFTGTDGADSLLGGADGDLLQGLGGDDTLDGGAGFDLFNFTDPYMGGDDVVTDFVHGEDHIVIEQRSEVVSVVQDGADTVVNLMIGDPINGEVTGTVRLLGVDASTIDASDFLSWDDGTAGNDQMQGSAHADMMSGEEGKDRIVGGDGGDLLWGGDGRDHLIGGKGDDTLSGGQDADILKGGAGADVFLFGAHDSGDRIVDFNVAQGDLIDLSGIDARPGKAGDQAFHFVDAFDGHGGEARLSYGHAYNVTVLDLDINGDGKSDYTLTFNGHVDPGAGWVL